MPVVGMSLDNEMVCVSLLGSAAGRDYPGVSQLNLFDQSGHLPLLLDRVVDAIGLRALGGEHLWSKMLDNLCSGNKGTVDKARAALTEFMSEVNEEVKEYFQQGDEETILAVALPFTFPAEGHSEVIASLEAAGWDSVVCFTEPEATLLGYHLTYARPSRQGRVISVHTGLAEFTVCMWRIDAERTQADFELLSAQMVPELSGRVLAEALAHDVCDGLDCAGLKNDESVMRAVRLWLEHQVLPMALKTVVIEGGEAAKLEIHPDAIAPEPIRDTGGGMIRATAFADCLKTGCRQLREHAAAMDIDDVGCVFISGRNGSELRGTVAEALQTDCELLCSGQGWIAADGAAYYAALENAPGLFRDAFIYGSRLEGSVGLELADGRFDRLLALDNTGWWCRRRYRVQRNGQPRKSAYLELRKGQYLTASENEVVARIKVPLKAMAHDDEPVVVSLRLDSRRSGTIRISGSESDWEREKPFKFDDSDARGGS